ncbi:hypothetical protein C8R45DRAFT_1135505 [Mycena sanguinolenta]|nr:hypothetical protein C8R45DRAFT_1135505 [Mycena sanguinolenta]
MLDHVSGFKTRTQTQSQLEEPITARFMSHLEFKSSNFLVQQLNMPTARQIARSAITDDCCRGVTQNKRSPRVIHKPPQVSTRFGDDGVQATACTKRARQSDTVKGARDIYDGGASVLGHCGHIFISAVSTASTMKGYRRTSFRRRPLATDALEPEYLRLICLLRAFLFSIFGRLWRDDTSRARSVRIIGPGLTLVDFGAWAILYAYAAFLSFLPAPFASLHSFPLLSSGMRDDPEPFVSADPHSNVSLGDSPP